MAQQFGVTPNGFVAKQQQQIISEMESSVKQAFGNNLNLAGTSVFGQLIGIFSEREALVWQLNEAVYDSEYPSGAEGTSVDNILSYNNLRRLGAIATKTAPTDTSGNPGLVLLGTPGTLIPAGSIIGIPNSTLQFTLDQNLTIAAAVNAVQSIFLSNVPTQGSFTLSIEDPAENVLQTPAMPWNTLSNQSQYSFVTPPVSGTYKLVLTRGGVAATTTALAYNAPATGAGSVQAAIQALAGFSAVTVSGSFSAGFVISWGTICQPLLTTTANSTGSTITTVDSAQAAVNNLFDSVANNYPYTDVTATGFTMGYVFTFGSIAPLGSNPASGSQPQQPFVLVANSLQNGPTVTNINIVQTALGAPAQAIGSATCTQTGPNFVAAGTLTVIGSPVSGWASVNNPLDCITGSNIEDDTQALQRRLNRLNSTANGPLQSIVQKVQAVAGVTAAIGFQNLTNAALQVIMFPQVPTSGNFQIVVKGYSTGNIAFNASAATIQAAVRLLTGFSTALVSGSFISGFTIDFNGSYGGQPQELLGIANNTLMAGLSAVTPIPSFGRPGKAIEIVAQGGDPLLIAQTIWGAGPAGIQTYGNVTETVTDNFGKKYLISFSRPTQVPLYVTISMVTDLLTADVPQFNPSSILLIQQQLAAIANAVPIGGVIVGRGTGGLVGGFNNIPGIVSYRIGFDRMPNPSLGMVANIQLQAEEAPELETFNIVVSYT